MRCQSGETLGFEAAERAPLHIAAGLASRMRGLLFSPVRQGVLLLAPCRDIHTVGMRHALDIAFVDADGMVVEAYRDVGPMRRVRCRKAVATIERFSESTPWFTAGDRVEIGIASGESKIAERGRSKR